MTEPERLGIPPNEDLSELLDTFKVAWIQETSNGEWDSECPELNQCAVTALVIQDLFGGELLRCPTKKGSSHYWNLLPNGEEVDLTINQFSYSGDIPIKAETLKRDRGYVLSFPDTKARYELLSTRVKNILEDSNIY